MATKSAFSVVGLAHKVCLAAEEQGYTPELLNALAEHPTLFRDTLSVQLGHEVRMVKHLIDLDAGPFLPKGWEAVEHRKGGVFEWDPAQVQFYFSEPQRKGKVIVGNKLREELAEKPVLNANVLDYLLAHPHLVPEEWKQDSKGRTLYVFFWGTIYRDSCGGLCVRCLVWGGGGWRWDCRWLGSGWSVHGPAALRAS